MSLNGCKHRLDGKGAIMSDDRIEGKVKWFDTTKGYGFIVGDDAVDRFVHVTEIPAEVDRLREGQKVTFRLGKANAAHRAPPAVDVQIVSPAT